MCNSTINGKFKGYNLYIVAVNQHSDVQTAKSQVMKC